MIYKELHLKDTFPQLGQNGCDPTLRVYLPDPMPELCGRDTNRPAILIIPGGGYVTIGPRETEPIALHFLPHGYNLFILTYSVAPNRFPTQLREVAAAMELICANAKQWYTDPERIAIMGFSAGGHLAAHYSNAYDCPEVRQMFPESKPVKAALLGYPVLTADPRYDHHDSFKALTGHDELTAEEIEKFSCERMVTPRTPPTFLWHTAEDPLVPVMNSILYAQALAEHKVEFALHIYPKGYHALATVDHVTCVSLDEDMLYCREWLESARKWLEIVL